MIELRHVTKQFKKSVVLDDLDLDIAAGERVALIGSNGAGKTTLIRCLLGEYVHAGELSVLGLYSGHTITTGTSTRRGSV